MGVQTFMWSMRNIGRLVAMFVLIGCFVLGSLIADEIVVEAGSSSSTATNAPAVLVVAHEGARSAGYAQRALTWQADVLEMDAVAWHGQLYVSHQPVTSATAGSTPRVNQVWPVACHARIVEFDLKDSSPAFDRLLVAFLRAHRQPGMPQVFVSGRDLSSLRAIHAGAPWVFRFLSVGDDAHLDALQHHPAMVAGLDGVSIRQSLLQSTTIAWFHHHRLLVFAWTVDSTVRAQELVRDGVDGITTDEPAIIGQIAHQEHGKAHLLRDRTA